MSTRVNSRCGLFIGIVRLRQSFLARPQDGCVRKRQRMKVLGRVDIIDAIISTTSPAEGLATSQCDRSLTCNPISPAAAKAAVWSRNAWRGSPIHLEKG